MIELEAGDAWVTIHPSDGGRLGHLSVAGREILHHDARRGPTLWGSYPMAPWAGRIRNGRFSFRDQRFQMPLNLPPHAIHGTTFDRQWEVLDAGRDYCELQIDLDWPLGGRAHQHLQLHDDGIGCVLTVVATIGPLPAVLGWHPCFVKPISAELDFARMYRRNDSGITTGELESPAPHPWDDCFIEPLGPLRLRFPGLTVTVASDCDHWVVYDEQSDLTCVEPQSGPPDAFNLGLAPELAPGEMLQRHMTINWQHD